MKFTKNSLIETLRAKEEGSIIQQTSTTFQYTPNELGEFSEIIIYEGINNNNIIVVEIRIIP